MFHLTVRLICYAAISVCLSSAVFGQSKDETKKFLSEKGTWTERYADGSGQRDHTVSFDGDSLVTTRVSKGTKTGDVWADKYTVKLADINPARIEVRGNVVDLKCRDGKVVANECRRGTSAVEKCELLGWEIFVRDERDARRIGKALVHLVTMHGGKADLFDD